MEEKLKEVFFNQWCPKCKHFLNPEDEEPCDECLYHPGNQDSHKPVNFESK